MHRRLTSIAFSAIAAALVAGVLIASGGATAAPAKTGAAKGAPFRQVLAGKLGAQLDKPAADVLAAVKTATKAGKPRTKGEKLSKSARRARAAARRKAWTESVAKTLAVEPGAVTAAVQALVKERLESLVEDGWLTAAQRDQRLQKGKLGIAFLRVGVR